MPVFGPTRPSFPQPAPASQPTQPRRRKSSDAEQTAGIETFGTTARPTQTAFAKALAEPHLSHALTLSLSRQMIACRWLRWSLLRACEFSWHPVQRLQIELRRHPFTRPLADDPAFVGRVNEMQRGAGANFFAEAEELTRAVARNVVPFWSVEAADAQPFAPVLDPPLCPLPRAAYLTTLSSENWTLGADEGFALFDMRDACAQSSVSGVTFAQPSARLP